VKPPHRMGAGHLDDGIYKQRDNLHAEFQNVSMAVNCVPWPAGRRNHSQFSYPNNCVGKLN
jgi:hypothetical protein